MRTLMACMVALWAIGSCASAYAGAAGSGPTALDGQVTVAGEVHDTPRVTSHGSGVPLRAALRRMVPVTYSINLPNAGAWAATPVSWSAGHSLAQTLREMLANHPELAAQVDTDFQLVTVRYRQPFGADTVGALMPLASAASSPSAAPPVAAAAHAGAAVPGVVVGGPMGGAVTSAGLPQSMPAAANAGPQGLPPRLSSPSSSFASAGGGSRLHPATHDARAPLGTAPLPERGSAAPGVHPVAAPLPASAALRAGIAPVPAEPPMQTWRVELSDRTVRGALTRWTREAGWRLIWEAPVDFAVDAPATVNGTFEQALQSVIRALSGTDAPVQAILYRGNKVLRIVQKGAG